MSDSIASVMTEGLYLVTNTIFDTPRVKTAWIPEVVYDGDKSTVIDAFLVKGLSSTPPSASAIPITDTAF
jgi:hypothetical protein